MLETSTRLLRAALAATGSARLAGRSSPSGSRWAPARSAATSIACPALRIARVAVYRASSERPSGSLELCASRRETPRVHGRVLRSLAGAFGETKPREPRQEL